MSGAAFVVGVILFATAILVLWIWGDMKDEKRGDDDDM